MVHDKSVCKCKKCPICGHCLVVSFIFDDGYEICSPCYRDWERGMIKISKSCPECSREFDLNNEDDAIEWYYGHDCEVE